MFLNDLGMEALVDRVTFALNEDAQEAWEEINGRPAISRASERS